MIIYKKGNLFTSNADVFAHGCNCIGGFGAGIALQFSTKFPASKEAYVKKHQTIGWKLGEVQLVKEANKIIANCATQYGYGKYGNKKIHADYNAIETCFKKLYKYVKENNKSIAIPKIGAGLAGGDWQVISKIIEEIFHDIEIEVWEF